MTTDSSESAQNVSRPAAGSQTTRMAVLIGVVVLAAIAVVLVLVLHHSGKHKPKQHFVVGIGPKVETPKQLGQQSRIINTKFYWAGKQGKNYRYEFTRSTKGYLYVRYLPKGVPVGAKGGNYLIVVTYPFPGGYKALKKQAKAKAVPGPGNSIIFQRPKYKKSVLMAFSGGRDQIEIYAPSPSAALAIATSGAIKPVGK